MTRQELIRKIHQRREEVGITLENLAKLSGLGIRTLNRLFAGEDVKFSTIEKVTNFLGLDFSGNEVMSLEELKNHRAYQKALFMVSLVQSTSALEKQGLDKSVLDDMIEEFQVEFLEGAYRKNLWVA